MAEVEQTVVDDLQKLMEEIYSFLDHSVEEGVVVQDAEHVDNLKKTEFINDFMCMIESY
jgi:hypothetical protein